MYLLPAQLQLHSHPNPPHAPSSFFSLLWGVFIGQKDPFAIFSTFRKRCFSLAEPFQADLGPRALSRRPAHPSHLLFIYVYTSVVHMDEWTIKTPNPICRLFFQIDLWHCVNRFFRLEIHSLMVGIFDQFVNCLLPPWTKELYLSTVAHLPSLPPPPSQTKCTAYTDSVWLCEREGGGVELCWRPYSSGVLHSTSDQVQNLQNCFTTPNKMTSKYDI